MKIYKISQNFEILPQDPNAQNDPNIQLQNLQNAQKAIQYFKEIISVSEKVMTDLRELEDKLGIGDIDMRSQFQETIKMAAQQTGAFNLLAQMNLISSIDNLLNQGELNNVEILINTNIQSMSSQYSSTDQMNQ